MKVSSQIIIENMNHEFRSNVGPKGGLRVSIFCIGSKRVGVLHCSESHCQLTVKIGLGRWAPNKRILHNLYGGILQCQLESYIDKYAWHTYCRLRQRNRLQHLAYEHQVGPHTTRHRGHDDLRCLRPTLFYSKKHFLSCFGKGG